MVGRFYQLDPDGTIRPFDGSVVDWAIAGHPRELWRTVIGPVSISTRFAGYDLRPLADSGAPILFETQARSDAAGIIHERRSATLTDAHQAHAEAVALASADGREH